MQNIGGIANVTFLPPLSDDESQPLAFDTGPGNALIDAVAAAVTGGRLTCDLDGQLAYRGRVDEGWLADMLRHPYFERRPPRTTGRELFGEAWALERLAEGHARGLTDADVVATLTALTAASIADAYGRFAPCPIEEVVLGGGGARNPALVEMIRGAMPGVPVLTHEDLGLSGDLKEALVFALLAYETWHNRPGVLPALTGARRATVLGQITPGTTRELVATNLGGRVAETLVVGVDGGGTHLRVVVTDERLRVLGTGLAGSANPSVVGRDVAGERVVSAIAHALDEACMPPEKVSAAGLGIAGASVAHSADWVLAVGRAALPTALVVPSADYEIALAGANGRLEGVIIAAGTGSVAYGVSPAGESALAGGWGYLLGDEGGGYWLGLEALRAITLAEDGRGSDTALSAEVAAALGIEAGRAALIAWLYRGPGPRDGEIAGLAPLVLRLAEQGDAVAADIVRRGAAHLADLGRAVADTLALGDPRYALAGGLLAEANPLSVGLCQELGLAEMPRPRYSPVLGAALLALRALGFEPQGDADVDRE